MVGDLTLEQVNKQAWISKRKKVIINGRETMLSSGDRIRHIRTRNRTAVLQPDNRFRDEQIPQLIFDAPSAWVDFARRTDPANRGNPVGELNQIDGWKDLEILPDISEHWTSAEQFYQATPNRRTQHARAAKPQSKAPPKPEPEVALNLAPLLSDEPILAASVPLGPHGSSDPASEDSTEDSIEPVLKKQKSPSKTKQLAKRQRVDDDPKKELRQRYLKFMEETKHARYVPIKFDSSWKAFWKLHYGKKCPFCLCEMRSYESDGTLSGESCHVISRFYGSPKSCDRDNLIFGCQICNSRKAGDGMAERNALSFVLEISEDQFLNLSQQLFLYHIGDLTRKELHGWSWVDLLDCYDYILNRFIEFPFGWTDDTKKRAKELLHSEIFSDGKRKQLEHNSNQIAILKKERRQIKNDLKRE